MSDARPTRRAVLATGLAAVTAFVAGCARTGASGVAGAASATSPAAAATSATATTSAAATSAAATPTSAAAVAPSWATAVAKVEASLVADYTSVIKAHPALKARLTPLLTAHSAHLTALASSLSGAAVKGGGGSDEAIGRLIQAEQKASDVAAKQCLTCPTSAAALLGSIAAANASHIVVLSSIGAS